MPKGFLSFSLSKNFPFSYVSAYVYAGILTHIYIAVARARLRMRCVSQNVHKELQTAQFNTMF